MPLFRTSLLLLVLGTRGLFADANTTISAAEYFVDTDPGEGSGTALTAQDGAFDSEVEAIAPVDFNVTGLSVGPHLIGIRYKDNNNTWGEVLYQTIHVYDANPSGSGSGGSGGGGGCAGSGGRDAAVLYASPRTIFGAARRLAAHPSVRASIASIVLRSDTGRPCPAPVPLPCFRLRG